MSEQGRACRVRPAHPDDLAAAVALNQADVQRLSPLTVASLQRLASMAAYFSVVEGDGAVAGFLLAMREDAPYESVNFGWFKARYAEFFYVDRVVVAAGRRRGGVASDLYRDLEARAVAAGCPLLGCEVNVHPPNPESVAFHDRHGFVEVGTQDTDQGAKTVSLRVKSTRT